MRISKEKLDYVLAEQCKAVTELRAFLSPATIARIRQSQNVGTKTAGKLARALGVTLDRLIETREG